MRIGFAAVRFMGREFWMRLRNGKTMLKRYGGTKFAAIKVPLCDEGIPINFPMVMTGKLWLSLQLCS